MKDTDGDGIPDGVEDANRNGIVDAGETDPCDADSDDDGLIDGTEDKNANGLVDAGETDPRKIDTDGDGIQDGTESGYELADIGPDTDSAVFKPDEDPSTTTSPVSWDSNGNGLSDGAEDLNHNGRLDNGETDPRCADKGQYTQEDLDAAVKAERERWDTNNDNKIGIEEAINALQSISDSK